MKITQFAVCAALGLTSLAAYSQQNTVHIGIADKYREDEPAHKFIGSLLACLGPEHGSDVRVAGRRSP